MIKRRHFFGLAATGLGTLWSASAATACSIVPVNRTPFHDRLCRSAIADFVKLLNEAPTLSIEELARRKDEMKFFIEDEWIEEQLGFDRPNGSDERQYAFIRQFRISGGKVDPKPIVIDGINLIRQLGNRATYQFTLKSYAYHPADWEGCNGLFTHDEYYGYDRLSCLATFSANRLDTVRRFPEWYLEA